MKRFTTTLNENPYWEIWLPMVTYLILAIYYFLVINPNYFMGSSANGIAVDSQQNIYLNDTYRYLIKKFDSNGNLIKSWGGEGTDNGKFLSDFSPNYLAFNKKGQLFALDPGNQRIQVFDTEGNFIYRIQFTRKDSEKPIESGTMAFDSRDNLYLATLQEPFIRKYDSQGNFLAAWGSSGEGDGQFTKGVYDIAIDSNDILYVVDGKKSRIQKFDSQGNFLTNWGKAGQNPGELYKTAHIAIDSKNNVYVSDNSRVQKFDSQGQFLLSWVAVQQGKNSYASLHDFIINREDNPVLLNFEKAITRIETFDSQGNLRSEWFIVAPDWLRISYFPLVIIIVNLTIASSLLTLQRKKNYLASLNGITELIQEPVEMDGLNLVEMQATINKNTNRSCLFQILAFAVMLFFPTITFSLLGRNGNDNTALTIAVIIILLLIIVGLFILAAVASSKAQKPRKIIDSQTTKIFTKEASKNILPLPHSYRQSISNLHGIIFCLIGFITLYTLLIPVFVSVPLRPFSRWIENLPIPQANWLTQAEIIGLVVGLLLIIFWAMTVSGYLRGHVEKVTWRDILSLTARIFLAFILFTGILWAFDTFNELLNPHPTDGSIVIFPLNPIGIFTLILSGYFLFILILSAPYFWVRSCWCKPDYDGALRRVGFLRTITFDGFSFRSLYTDTLVMAGRIEEAEILARQSLNLVSKSEAPFQLSGLELLGDVFLVQGRYSEIIEFLEKPLAMSKGMGSIYSLLAEAYLRQGIGAQTALALVDQGIKNRKNSLTYRLIERYGWGDLLENRAWALARLGRTGEAEEQLAKAFKQTDRHLKPALADMYWKAGKIKLLLGDRNTAIQNFEQAIVLDPTGTAGINAKAELEQL